MADTRATLIESITLTFDANGNATGSLAPNKPFERWEINRYTTFSTSVGCIINIFKTFISVSTFLDGTLKGENDAGGIQISLHTSENVWVQASGGVPSQTVMVTFYGTKIFTGDRGYQR